MPTYLNGGTNTVKVELFPNGEFTDLPPGSSLKTTKYYDTNSGYYSDLSLISDTPYINPILAYHEVDLPTISTQTITLTSPNIAKIRVQKVVGSINVYLQNIGNTPAVLQKWLASDFPIDITIKGRASKIVVESNETNSSVQILELKEL